MGTKIARKGTSRRSVSSVLALSAALLFAVPASAQSQSIEDENVNTPVSASSLPAPTDSGMLPADLKPEKLSTPRTTTVPLIGKNKNQWDPATLTQSTGLSASSSRQVSTTKPSPRDGSDEVGPGVLGSDLLSAEDLLNVGSIEFPDVETALAVPSRTDGPISLNSSLRGTLFNSPTDSVNASVFKLDLGERLCLGTAEECAANEYEKIELGYAKNITHGKFDGLNLQLTPRAGLRFNEDGKSALVGALVRIGDNLREGAEMKSNTWYFFAGADAEAVTYTPTGVRRLTSGEFHLQDRIIVGDAQAGLGYRIGSADLALTYYKRQAKAENYSYDEDAAALSLTWKR